VATAIVSHHVCSAVPSAVEPTKPHASVYDIVTERILAELEKGQVPWRKPWRTLPPANLSARGLIAVSTCSYWRLLVTVRNTG
jgi:N-terminal domain of anti-restriction factor ArdC